jgi:Uncharacterized conserved protein (DUF2164)
VLHERDTVSASGEAPSTPFLTDEQEDHRIAHHRGAICGAGRAWVDYVLKEIGPLAYNRGVQDAEEFFRKRLEDLPGTCFEPPLTYWQTKKKR